MFLEMVGVSILLSMVVFGFFVMLLIVIEALSGIAMIKRLFSPYKVGRRVISPFFGKGKIVLVNSDNVVVQYNHNYQAYDIKGKAILEVRVRSDLKSTIRDNIKVIK